MTTEIKEDFSHLSFLQCPKQQYFGQSFQRIEVPCESPKQDIGYYPHGLWVRWQMWLHYEGSYPASTWIFDPDNPQQMHALISYQICMMNLKSRKETKYVVGISFQDLKKKKSFFVLPTDNQYNLIIKDTLVPHTKHWQGNFQCFFQYESHRSGMFCRDWYSIPRHAPEKTIHHTL